MGELGRALQSLAADLGSAKAAATAAVADSRRLNVVGDEVNLRAARELAMHPLLNSPSPAIEASAAEVTAAQSGASTALWGAEANATSAWNRARASFDFVAEGTPAVHATWSDPNWDPAKSVHLGRPTGMSDGSLAWAGAPVGGMLMGPDQRDYHLEIGTALDTEGDRVINDREPSGKDGDWTELFVRTGYTTYGPKASGWDKAEIIAGGLAGAPYPEGSAYDKDKLKDVTVMADGGSFLKDAENVEGGSIKEVSGEQQRGQGNELWAAPRGGIAGGKTSTAPDAVGLVDGLLTGIALAMHLNDSRLAKFRVVFEENSVGELRARMLFYRVTDAPGGPEAIDTQAAFVGTNGSLASTPVTGEAAGLRPIAY
jgi:hypothetical protein